MQILVIRFSSMGDVILTTPVFDFLKTVHETAQITFLTDKNYVDLFADDPRLNSVLGLHKSDAPEKIPVLKEKWDYVIDLQNSRRSHKLVNSIKGRQKNTFFKKLHFHRTILLLIRLNIYPRRSDVISRYLKAAGYKPGNAKNVPPLKLFFKKAPSIQYDKMLQTDSIIRPTIALFPFSAWKNKEWPIKYFMIVAKFFITKGWNVVIMGNQAEKEQAEQLRTLIGTKAISLAGQLSLYECGCVLSKCSLALGNDSGLSHLARACGVKTGIIYGPTTKHFGFFPSGEPPFKVFEMKMRCRPCHPHGGNICMRMKHFCMKDILPDKVIKGLVQLFDES